MVPAQRIVMVHQLKFVDELLSRANLEDFAVTTTAATTLANNAADYMSNPACDEPDLYSIKLAELLDLFGEQLLLSLTELRRGFESTSSSAKESKKCDIHVHQRSPIP